VTTDGAASTTFSALAGVPRTATVTAAAGAAEATIAVNCTDGIGPTVSDINVPTMVTLCVVPFYVYFDLETEDPSGISDPVVEWSFAGGTGPPGTSTMNYDAPTYYGSAGPLSSTTYPTTLNIRITIVDGVGNQTVILRSVTLHVCIVD
jgi:hypothetical protein